MVKPDPANSDPRGCGSLPPFGTMRWYDRVSLEFAWEEHAHNRMACGAISNESVGARAVKLCRPCAIKAGAEW